MSFSKRTGLYVHIPFCHRRCHFCAFYLEITRADRIAKFMSALTREIELVGQQHILQGRSLQSVYLGGGTPTVLLVSQLTSLLKLIRAAWPVLSTAELTVEAHPASITTDDLMELADAGFNRISLGAESMQDQDLIPIGRFGRVRDTEAAVQAARTAGFHNINLDLMYGLPGQSVNGWRHTLELVLTLEPSHVSCYALTIEDGTPLADQVAEHPTLRPDDTLLLEMESVAEDLLTHAGFTRYEISNYAKPGFRCQHNVLYWTGGAYLGLGPSAQSYINGLRFGNIDNLDVYVDELVRYRLPTTDQSVLSTVEQHRDALVFGLRLLRGVPLKTVESAGKHEKINELKTKGLLDANAERVWLTSLGRRYADTVAEELF